MAEIHDPFAGRGQMVLLNLEKPSAALHDNTRAHQHGQMFARHVVTASTHSGQFGNLCDQVITAFGKTSEQAKEAVNLRKKLRPSRSAAAAAKAAAKAKTA